jgi:hypothetical protein
MVVCSRAERQQWADGNKSRARRAVCLAGVALALCVAFVASRPGIAFASSATISGAQALPPTPDGGGLNAVQCWAVGHCLAVGGSARGVLVDRLSGTRWSLVAAPNPGGGGGTPSLNGLSCIGSRWCLAVGSNRCGGPSAERWNGKSWSLVSIDLPECQSGVLTDVSCASRSFCMAVDSTGGAGGVGGGGIVVTWDGTSWLGYQNGPDNSPNDFLAVSCAAQDACAEVGYTAETPNTDSVVGWWNGHDWRLNEFASRPGFPGASSVSCPSVTFCMAVGSEFGTDYPDDAGLAIARNGSRWGREAYLLPLRNAVAVSCASRSDCVAVNYPADAGTGPATTFNGRSWRTTPSAFHASPAAISCPVSGWCMVVGGVINVSGLPVTPAAGTVR